MIKTALQNASHDWLGEAAENYVRYIFAREGFMVFAGSKWGADCAMYHKDNPARWWRIEVRSTDTGKWPGKKLVLADFVIDIMFEKGAKKMHSAEVYLSIVDSEGRYEHGQYGIVPVRKGNSVKFLVEGRRTKLQDAEGVQSFIRRI